MTFESRSLTWGGVSLAGVALAIRVVLRPLAATPSVTLPALHPVTSRRAAHVPLDSLTEAIVGQDPFRVARRPASLAYDPARTDQSPGQSTPMPVLSLTGIVWSARDEASAVIEGLPGAVGARVVRPGDQIGGLRVRRIDRDRVVIAGLDNVWTLTVREPWK